MPSRSRNWYHVSRTDGLRVLVLSLLVVSCATAHARVPPPRSRSVVVSPVQRILVAGFVADGQNLVDVNGETVRLLRSELRGQGALGVIQADPVTLSTEAAFADIAYWRAVGEEYGAPLIVTGAVKLKPAPPKVSQRGGRAGVYIVEPGLFLETDIVLIDGATGQVQSSEHLPRKVRYGLGRRASPSLMYFAMMDSLMPDLVRAVLAPPRNAIR